VSDDFAEELTMASCEPGVVVRPAARTTLQWVVAKVAVGGRGSTMAV
jgi:hypothetical protein